MFTASLFAVFPLLRLACCSPHPTNQIATNSEPSQPLSSLTGRGIFESHRETVTRATDVHNDSISEREVLAENLNLDIPGSGDFALMKRSANAMAGNSTKATLAVPDPSGGPATIYELNRGYLSRSQTIPLNESTNTTIGALYDAPKGQSYESLQNSILKKLDQVQEELEQKASRLPQSRD